MCPISVKWSKYFRCSFRLRRFPRDRMYVSVRTYYHYNMRILSRRMVYTITLFAGMTARKKKNRNTQLYVPTNSCILYENWPRKMSVGMCHDVKKKSLRITTPQIGKTVYEFSAYALHNRVEGSWRIFFYSALFWCGFSLWTIENFSVFFFPSVKLCT